MATSLTTELVDVVRAAARAVTGFARRNFQATLAAKYCDSNPRHAESVFGWNRKAVGRGLEEQTLGKAICLSNDPHGRPTVESKDPAISTISRQLLAEKTQVDPKFQTSHAFTRMTCESLRKALAEQLGIPIARLPAARTLRRVMNRNGFLLKKVRKTMPLKKIKKTNAIFDNVSAAHARASQVFELDEALTRLEELYPEKARLVKLRFFAGLTNNQTACALGISTATADRHWAFARAWLKTEMER